MCNDLGARDNDFSGDSVTFFQLQTTRKHYERRRFCTAQNQGQSPTVAAGKVWPPPSLVRCPGPLSPRHPIITRHCPAMIFRLSTTCSVHVSPSAGFVVTTSYLFIPPKVCRSCFCARPLHKHQLLVRDHSTNDRISCSGLPRGMTDFSRMIYAPIRATAASSAIICARSANSCCWCCAAADRCCMKSSCADVLLCFSGLTGCGVCARASLPDVRSFWRTIFISTRLASG